MKTLLLIGTNGYLGRNFYQYIKENTNYRIYGVDRAPSQTLPLENHFTLNLSEVESVKKCFLKTNPDFIANFTGSCTNDFALNFAANVQTSHHILEALKAISNTKAHLLLLGSAAQYGIHTKEALSEKSELAPVSSYGLVKNFQEQLGAYYSSQFGLRVSTARVFNIIGPQMPSRLFVGSFFEKLDQFRRKEIAKIQLGPLDATRDYVDVRDVVRAFELILTEEAKCAVYNVGNGVGITPREIVDYTLKRLGFSSDTVESSPPLLKATNHSVADIGLIQKKLGWKPKFVVQDSLEYILSMQGWI